MKDSSHFQKVLLAALLAFMIEPGCGPGAEKADAGEDAPDLEGQDPFGDEAAGDPTGDQDAVPGDPDAPEAIEDQDAADVGEEEVVNCYRTDADHDSISDCHEGNGAVDTDGDGTPDNLDQDSDNDTIDDLDEAGDAELLTAPVDSDGDGTADFRDQDSDNDRILDSVEGTEDPDGDGIPNFRDNDSDGDFIPDAIEGIVDSDGDGDPDFLDLDSDSDTIDDMYESLLDDDSDGIPNYLDLDSDGDTHTDVTEAGGEVPPRNCDGDDKENFRDPDSDADGLPDRDERYTGCPNVCNQDSDFDGVQDLVEVAYGLELGIPGIECNPADNPLLRGDFVFIVPYLGPPDPAVDTLSFSTSLRHADVYFLIDTTGSMGGEIINLRNTLTTTIIPAVRGTFVDVWFGVGGFDDYPVNPYGYPGDRVFYQEQRMTSSDIAAQNAVNRLALHDGGDRPESHVPALWAIATGSGLGTYLAPQTSCSGSECGYPCFREGTVPIIVLVTDAPFHNDSAGNDPYSGITPAPPDYATARSALTGRSIRVLGVNSGDSISRSDLEQLARDTGTVDRFGSPLVFNIPADGTGLGDQVVSAIWALANRVPIRVNTRTEDDPTDPVDATVFIDRIEPNVFGVPAEGCVGGLAVGDSDGDTLPDTFTSVLPGTTVCFDIYAALNDSVPSLLAPQLFKAFIHVVGDDITILDTRWVYFLVPPTIEQD